VVIVEGPLDALAASGEGWVGVAIMGSQPTDAVLDHIVTRFWSLDEGLVLPDLDSPEWGPRVCLHLAAGGLKARLGSPRPYLDLAAAPKAERAAILDAASCRPKE